MKLEKTRANIFKACDSILARIVEWDNELESGIEIIEKNEEDIKTIQECYQGYPDEVKKLQMEENYLLKIEELASEMGDFLERIKAEKQILVGERKQYANSDAVIENYISSNIKSVFIDRDV